MTYSKRSVIVIFCGLFAVCVSLPGCGLTLSGHPVSTEETSVVDERLIGMWQGIDSNVKPDSSKNESERGRFILFSKQNNSKQMLMTLIGEDEKKNISAQHMVLLTSSGNVNYVSFKVDDGSYLIARYSLESEDRILSIRFVDSVVIGRAIENRALAGEVRRAPVEALKPGQTTLGMSSNWKSIRITASPPNLKEFLDAHPECFEKDAKKLQRVSADELDKMFSRLGKNSPETEPTNRNETSSSVIYFTWAIGFLVVGFLFGIGYERIRRKRDQKN